MTVLWDNKASIVSRSLTMENNLHANHRSRLRRRFQKEGLAHFGPHQMLELLLCYAIPRRDVNPLAHRLIDRFGSLSGVFEAEYEELLRCPGVGENTATLLRMIAPLCRAYMMDKESRYPNFGDMHKLGSYLVNYYIGETREKLVAIYLNNRGEMIDLAVISEGTVNRTEVDARRVAEKALQHRAASVVLAHNHPDGTSEPSESDLGLTSSISQFLSQMAIPLAEHFIVAGHRYTGIVNFISTGKRLGLEGLKQLCMGAPSPTEQHDHE